MPVNIAIIDDLLVEALTPEQFIIQATSNDAVPAMTSAIGFIVDNDGRFKVQANSIDFM